MTRPLPPTVQGPITPHSPSVQVTGVLANAEIRLFAGSNEIGGTIASTNGTASVPFGNAPHLGDVITATQENNDGESASSPGVPVVDLPHPLPSPIFVSPLSTAMSSVRLGGLVPGARVQLKHNSTLVGQAVVTDTVAWVDISPGALLSGEITAQQDLAGVTSAVVWSAPLVSITPEGHVDAPVLATPINACDTGVSVTSAIATADIVADNEGTPIVWHGLGETYGIWGLPLLKEGKLIAHQAFPRLNVRGPDATFPVGPPVSPDKPAIQSDVCPEIAQVSISNLAPGGVLTLFSVTSNSSGATTSTPIGTVGVSAATETFNLPPDLDPSTGVKLAAQQERCGLSGPQSDAVGFAVPGAPAGPISIEGPLYACTSVIVVDNVHPGAQLVAYSNNTGQQLGDPQLVSQSTALYRTWLPIPDDPSDAVVIRQRGCSADADAKADIAPLPTPLPPPTIPQPIRPAAKSIHVTGFARGAMAYLFVNGSVRASQETLYPEASIAVPAPPLVEGDKVFVMQSLCAKSSAYQEQPSVVARGHLSVTPSPGSVQRTTSVNETVKAMDADTGAEVDGLQVLLDNANFGSTGTAFHFAPRAGQPNPAGLVKGGIQYIDQSFSITLTDPPPPTAKLHLKLSPTILVLGQLAIKVANWTATPMWDPTKKTTASGADAIVILPKPPASGGQVQIELTATWQAGTVDGYPINATVTGQEVPSPTVVVWDGAERTAGFLATYVVNVLPDGEYSLSVTENYQGFQ